HAFSPDLTVVPPLSATARHVHVRCPVVWCTVAKKSSERVSGFGFWVSGNGDGNSDATPSPITQHRTPFTPHRYTLAALTRKGPKGAQPDGVIGGEASRSGRSWRSDRCRRPGRDRAG